MRYVGVGVLIGVSCLGLAGLGCAQGLASEQEVSSVARSDTAFALDLYGRLRERPGNLAFSPHSIATALAMTAAGARGDTAGQMARVLHQAAGAEPHQARAALLAALRPSGTGAGSARPYQLEIANALWGQSGEPFQADFVKLTRDSYGAGLRDVDFAANPEAARRVVNAWVAQQTRDKIPDLIGPGVVTPLTRLILTNAVYFQGDWLKAFPRSATRDEPFTLAPGQTAPVPMMHQRGSFGYAEADGARLLALPYQGNALSMVVVLPRETDGLSALEQAISAEKLDGWLKGLQPRQVVVGLPRFRVEASASLKDALTALGMTDAFSEQKADFSGINGKPRDLYVSAVIHKAYVDVDEKGTEAAAATAVVVAKRSAPLKDEAIIFQADHPFLFLIRHHATGEILFLGRVADPRS